MRSQTTQRQTRKGSKKLTDDDRETQIAGFQDPEVAKEVAKFQAARAKMTYEEKAEEIDGARKQLGILPMKKKKPKGPYEVDTTEEADMTKQADAPAPEDTIEIGDDNDNDEWVHGQDDDDNNPCTLGLTVL